ncbi:uncharacterized protein EI90DRAFT_216148 [Cantharellus anzutake]|uniref:uncharacterized protein n=1 Tax=Cantharellus anzutake TaxID=1750568 RepID=UPI001905300F|nr:uncharacterized protein EI90DRAFT_216148 [Cantharellus anzutake]KAF8317028.1 hypothetical protein EI90DRAFT_216148 [Cantharellus anzutake]
MSIASTLEGEGTLAASFFWDKNRKGTGLDSLELFPSTLARQLALFSADFKVSLVKCLRRPEMRLFLKLSLEKQMRTLIIEPMNSLKRVLSGGSRRYAIILDGLDECGGPADLDSLMELVLLLCELPLPFAVLVSCRPESTVLSAWTRVQDQGLMIPCEDVDRIERDTFHTIRRMVDEGFHGFIEDSLWKPSDEDLDIFARGCRGLPIMASIRIRDAQFQIRYYGSTLKSEFEYFRNLNEAPMDLKSEYLRIMRRAYMPNSSSIRPHVAKNYREVVEILVAATWSDFDIDDISQLLGIAEDEVRSVLKPISSIVDLSSDNEQIVKFYHATAKEFITGDPIGEEQDKVFFIRDVKGYSIGLRLLQFVNDVIQKNEFGIPTELPLGDKKKWQLFQSKQIPRVVGNVLRHLFFHLDPSLLFSQDFNELQSEFEQLLTTNLLSFLSGNNGSLAWPTSQTNRLLVEWKSSVHVSSKSLVFPVFR